MTFSWKVFWITLGKFTRWLVFLLLLFSPLVVAIVTHNLTWLCVYAAFFIIFGMAVIWSAMYNTAEAEELDRLRKLK
jgi:Ca2+/Na+ antiporter